MDKRLHFTEGLRLNPFKGPGDGCKLRLLLQKQTNVKKLKADVWFGERKEQSVITGSNHMTGSDGWMKDG